MQKDYIMNDVMSVCVCARLFFVFFFSSRRRHTRFDCDWSSDVCSSDLFGLVGGGTSLEQMKSFAADLGVAEFVTFTGRVPDRELLAMLNTADVCVNPDIANEMNDKSTMNKVMEYMALGKPIVQFDLTEGRFSAQQASLYARRNDAVDFAGKIVELLDDPARRAAMGAFGRRRVAEHLEWRHEAPRLLAAYDALWGGSAPRRVPGSAGARLRSRESST